LIANFIKLALFGTFILGINPNINALENHIVVATYEYSGIDRAAAIKPLSQFIGHSSGQKTRIKIFESPSKLIEAFANGDVDIVVPNLSGYLLALTKNLPAEPIVVPEIPFAKATQYRSIILVRADSFIESDIDVATHRNKIRVALVWADSTSGGVIPLQKFKEMGIKLPDNDFRSLEYFGSHQKSLEALLASKVDLAGLALGVYENYLEENPYTDKKYKIIWSSQPIPVGPILCRSSESLKCNKLKLDLLESHQFNSNILKSLNMGWPEFGGAKKFIAPDLVKYQHLADVLREQLII